MPGKLKSTAANAGGKVLRIVKLLVLAFWIGGGLATVGLTSASFWKNYPEHAEKISSDILRWFSFLELVVGAVLCALLFFFESRHRKGYLTFSAVAILVLITLINQIAIADHSIYVSLFFLTIGIALVAFVIIALSGTSYHPEPRGDAIPEKPISPQPADPVQASKPLPPAPVISSQPAPDRAELLGEKGPPGELKSANGQITPEAMDPKGGEETPGEPQGKAM